MNELWLMPRAVVPVDVETTAALVAEIKRLIDVVGDMALKQAEKQKPVAIVTSETGNPDITMSWWHEPALPVNTKLYTAPPQREWVGLTADELNMIGDSMRTWNSHSLTDVYVAVEAKLKEKNT